MLGCEKKFKCITTGCVTNAVPKRTFVPTCWNFSNIRRRERHHHVVCGAVDLPCDR
jgi:hypothetical protein